MYRPPIPYPIQESILVGLFVGGEASKRLILFIARLRKGANPRSFSMNWIWNLGNAKVIHRMEGKGC